MSVTIAIVLNVSGQAWAEAPDGSRRLLEAGDALLAGEQLVTEDNAQVLLDFGYDNTATIDGGVSILATADMAPDFIPAVDETSVAQDSVAEALASIEEALGGSIEDAAAPAAGLDGGSAGGSSSVRLARVIEDISPAEQSLNLSAEQFDRAATDDGGNEGDSGETEAADPLPGTVAIDSLSQGSGVTPNLTTTGSVTNLSPGSSIEVTLTDQDGNTLTQTVTPGADGQFTAVFSGFIGIVDGPVSVQVTATGADGASVSDSADSTLDVTTGALDVTVDAIDNGTQTVTLSGTATDVAPGESVEVSIRDVDGNVVTTTATVAGDGTYSVAGVDVSDLIDGALTINASATDRNGNPVSDSETGTLDATAGGLTLTIDNVDNTNGTINLSGTTADVTPGETIAISITDMDGTVVNTTAIVATDGSYSVSDVDVSGLVDGNLTVEVSATDRNGNSVSDSKNDTLDAVDDVPSISGDTSGDVTEDDAVTLFTSGALSAEGGDPGEDQFTADTFTGTYGTLTLVEDGSWNYSADNTQSAIQDLASGDTLTDTFTVTNADGVTTETVTITINGTDDVPVISGDTTGSVTEDAASTLTTSGALTSNNGDAGEDTFLAETLTGTYGDLVMAENGNWAYSADNAQAAIQDLATGDTLTDTFSVTNADGVTTETVTITINGTDDVPLISGDTSGAVTEDAAATLSTTGTLTATGGDAGENQFTADTLTGTYGTLTLAEDGSWAYSADNAQAAIQDLAAGDTLTDTFTVTNADGVTTETVTITINGTDDVPVIAGGTTGFVAEDDAATLSTSGTLTASGGDAGEDTFIAETLTGTYGDLVMAENGTWAYSADNAQAAIQDLAAGQSLTDSFTVTNADGVTTETVTITINGTDDVPVISGDTTGAVTEDAAATLTATGTLTATDGDAGEDAFVAETLTGTYGDLVMAENGTWAYSADNAQAAIQDLAAGQSLTDSFTVTNADGVTTEAVTITINGSDDIPTITGDTTGSVAEDDAATLSTIGTLTANGGDAGENQFVADTFTGTYGDLVLAENGNWVYSADNTQAAIQELAAGDTLTDSFTVTNADGVTTETVTITINGTDDVPTISGDTTGSVTEDAAATLSTSGILTATGGDAGEDQFTAETFTGTYGTLTLGEDGSWAYSADNTQSAIQDLAAGETLTDSFTVTNADGLTTETVTITINGTDDVPVISGDTTGFVAEDDATTLSTTGTLTANGGDAGEGTFIAETLTGTYGDLVMAENGSWVYSADNAQAAIQDLAAGQSLTDSFTVTNADGVTTETVTITINGTDDVPVISGDTTGSVAEDDAATLSTSGTLAASGGDAGEDAFVAETLTGTYGDLVMAENGNWVYSADNAQAAIQDLAAGQSLTDTFTVTNADGVTTETVTITINGTDDVPLISGDTSGAVTEDAAATLSTAGTLAASGGDAGEDGFTAETLTGAYGDLVMAENGSWAYSADNAQAAIQDLAAGDTLTDSFTVTNADGVTTETVTITINGTDDVPLISGDTSGAVTEDAAATLSTTGTLTATGGDAGEDQFTADTFTGTYGTLTLVEDGSWAYSADNTQSAIQDLASGDTLTDTFTVTNADGVTTETVTITINGTDDVPVIAGDTAGTVTEDAAATLTTSGTLTATGGDAGEDQFVADTFTGTYGDLVLAENGSWNYSASNSQQAIQDLGAGQSLTDTFTVTNADGVTTETVTITINGTDDVPVISGDTTGSVTEDAAATLTTSGTLAASGGDAGEDTFLAETLTGTYGDLVMAENGGWAYSADNAQAAIQELAAGETLTDSFTVTNADGVTTETVTITINGTDDVPVISGDTTGSVAEDAAATLTTSGTLTATGGDAGEDQFVADTFTGTYGTLTLGAEGGWAYSADNTQSAIQDLAAGQSLTDTFTVTNADGVTTETVTITINGTDDVPVISGDTSGAVTEDAAATLSTAGTLAASGGDAGEDGFTAETLTGAYGDLVMAENGNWAYNADNSQQAIQELAAGDTLTDSFTVTNADGVTTETVTITINGTDDVPVIAGDTTGFVAEDDAATLTTSGDLSATGGDAGEDTFIAETLTGTYGDLVMAENGSWSYSASNSQQAIQDLAAGDTLTDTFTVTNADGVTTETVTITINGTEDVPVIAGDTTGAVTEDAAATLTTSGTLTATGGDTGENQFVADTFTGTYGDLVLAENGTWVYSADNAQAAIQDLAAGQSLTDTFTVTNADGVTTETVTITINGTDDVPVISGDITGSVAEDDAATLSTSGTLTATGGDAGEDQFTADTLTGTYGDLVMAENGSWAYSADNAQAAIQDLAAGDTLTDIFTVTNADGVTTETVTITINGSDDIPTITGDTAGTVTEDAAATLTTSGTLTATGGDAGEDQFVADTFTGTYGDLVMAENGSWNYSASNSQQAIQDLGAGQSLTDTFTVTNADGVTTETVTITINGTDDVPVISGDTTGSVTEDAAATLTTSGTLAASGGDAGEDAFVAETLTGTHGDLVMAENGNWSYSASNSQQAIQDLAAGDTLTDTFTVTNADGVTTETVTITINGTDDVPVISGDTTGSVAEDDAATLTTSGTLAASGGDAGEDAFVAETLTGTYGDLVMAENGNWSYSASNSQQAIQGLAAGDTLTDTFTVTNADGVTTETVTITINGTDDVPVISGDTTGSVAEDAAATLTATGTLTASGGDAGEDAFTAETLTGTYGDLVMAENGNWAYSADNAQTAIQDLAAGQSLTDTFTVTNADGVTTETVTITINGNDDVPVISGDTTGFVAEDDAATLSTTGTLTANGGDAGEGTFIAETLTGTYGDLVMAENGSWAYSADNAQAAIQDLAAGQSLTDSFTVTNADGVTTETVTITISGTNDAPIANGDTYLSGSIPGLFGEYYAYQEGSDGSNLNNVAQIENFTNANEPDATFVATGVDYGSVNGGLGSDGKLQDFLGSDASSLSTDPENSSDAIIRMTGELELAPGTYQFEVTADDGYRIVVNGETVAIADTNQAAATLEGDEFTLTGSGPHTVEIIYWDQAGGAELGIEIRPSGGTYEVFGSNHVSHTGENQALIVDENQSLDIAPSVLLANDTDADGDPLTIQSVQNATNGTVSIDGGGNVVFTPDAGYTGEASFTYTISDGQGGTDTATATINVVPNADAPTLSVADATSVSVGETIISTGSDDTAVDPSEFNSGSGINQGELERELGVPAGYLDGRFDPSGPNVNDPGTVNVVDGKVTGSTQALASGTTIEWDYEFVNGEDNTGEVSSGFNDLVVLMITSPSGAQEALLVDSSENKLPDQLTNGTFNYTTTEAGTYQFQWLVLNGGDRNKDSSLEIGTPSYTVSGLSGTYGAPVALDINAALSDQDGSETLDIVISGIPTDAALSAGTRNADDTWSLTTGELNGLLLLPADGYSGDLNLSVTATSTETVNGSQASVTENFTVTVDQTEATVGGSNSDDTLNGSAANDLIRGYTGNDSLDGNEGNDVLQGGIGNDTLTGGEGSDVLTGGFGADVFRWELGDEDSADAPSDVVTDFTIDNANGYTGSGEGDQLALDDLLQDATETTVTDFLMAQEENGDTVLYVNKDGALADSTDNAQQSIVLSGVTMDGQTSEQFIDTLVNSGQIKIE